jgi:hypothetical protein
MVYLTLILLNFIIVVLLRIKSDIDVLLQYNIPRFMYLWLLRLPSANNRSST